MVGAVAKTVGIIFLSGGVTAVGKYVAVTYNLPMAEELLNGALAVLALGIRRPSTK